MQVNDTYHEQLSEAEDRPDPGGPRLSADSVFRQLST